MADVKSFEINGTELMIKDEYARQQLDNIANQLGKNEDDSFKTLETDDKTIIGAINEVFQNASNGKSLIAQAITGKGVDASSTDTFQELADKISQIGGNSDTGDPAPALIPVVNNLTNCSNSNSATTIEENTSYTATISANSGYVLSSVTVIMGDTDITSSCYSDGTISIESVTGRIVITAIAIVQDTVVGSIDDNKNISLTGLDTGTYTLKYEDADGNVLDSFDTIAEMEVV